MKRILYLVPGFIVLGLSAPNTTDYFIKGSEAIAALQDFNFALEFNIYTTGGAKTTVQAMDKLKGTMSYFAASGCAATYTEILDTDSVYYQLQYLKDHIQWPRLSYNSRY
jgi:hypothetical protein